MKFKKVYDRKACCSRAKRTQAKTVMQYVQTYSGPEYLLHSKYSNIMAQVYVSSMYGLFVPMLFLITLLSIMIMYVVETLSLIYHYRKPPNYDDVLHKHALRYLMLSPFFMCLMGYWALGNPAIFYNTIQLKQHNSEVQDPMHKLFEFSYGFNATHIIFIIGVGYLLLTVARNQC